MKARLIILFTFLILMQTSVFSQSSNEISIGKKIQIDSEIYGKSRELFIRLPSNYNDSVKNYPVLYLLFPHASFFRARSAVGYLEGDNGIPEMMIVGICNDDGRGEILPFKIQGMPNSGGGNKFLSFIKKEVIPFVETNYRTDTLRILAGFSNSAMFANYLMVKDPGLFSSYILSSPMIAWGNDFVLKKTAKFFERTKSFDKTLYIIYGENDYDWVVDPMPDFETLLKEKAPDKLKWKIDVLKNEGHVPYIDVYNGIVFTFEKLNEK
jgi:hypothetical protein